MTIDLNFPDVFNKIENGAEFHIRTFVEMYEEMTKEKLNSYDRMKAIYCLKETTGIETEAVQIRQGSKPYIFKKVCDTHLDTTQIRIENFKKSKEKKKRIRSMEKAPLVHLPSSDEIAADKAKWFITPTNRQIIQQKFESQQGTIKNLRKQVSSLIDEVQTLTNQLRTRTALEPMDMSFLDKEI